MSTEPVADQAAILELGRRWAAAEVDKDLATLEAVAHPDLRLVGPFGFVLDHRQWLDRYQPGQLETTELTWEDVELRVLGDTAISIGRQRQKASYQGRPNDGDFRITHVFVRDPAAGDGWLIVGIHLSPIMQPGPPAGARRS